MFHVVLQATLDNRGFYNKCVDLNDQRPGFDDKRAMPLKISMP